jgi:radical SAM protein with 4Fe4S-binding SPASM domain
MSPEPTRAQMEKVVKALPWRKFLENRVKTLPLKVLEAAVAGQFLGAEEANIAIAELLGQVGALENRNAALESAVKAACRECQWRKVSLCQADCRARDYVDTAGLKAWEEKSDGGE